MPVVPGLGYATGVYQAALSTGVLNAALAADAPIAGMRCGPTQTAFPNPTTPPASIMAGTRRVYLIEIRLKTTITAAFTAVQQFGWYLMRYSVANLAGGVAAPILKLGSSTLPDSVALSGGPEAGDSRVATTAALTTAGVTLDATRKLPFYGWSSVGPGELYETVLNLRDTPIRLDLGEGIGIFNQIVWPAAGTAIVNAVASFEERMYQ
jgi:hypothetical protein